MGGKDVFKTSLFIGYELPKISIINKTKKKCFAVKQLTHREWIAHWFIR